jgi:hypothetical protein
MREQQSVRPAAPPVTWSGSPQLGKSAGPHRGNPAFGIVHRERIDLRSVGFFQTRTLKIQGRIFVEWAVAVSKVKRALQNADRVVVSFLAPAVTVCNGYETRCAPFVAGLSSRDRPPNVASGCPKDPRFVARRLFHSSVRRAPCRLPRIGQDSAVRPPAQAESHHRLRL